MKSGTRFSVLTLGVLLSSGAAPTWADAAELPNIRRKLNIIVILASGAGVQGC